MLKARAGNTVFLGLAHGNLDALKRGRPIDISLADLHMAGVDAKDVKLVIFAAEDNKALMQAMIDAGGIPKEMAESLLANHKGRAS